MFSIIKIAELNNEIATKYDVLITFCSFEDRCLTVLQNLSPELVGRTYYFMNQDAPKETLENAQTIGRLLGEKGRCIKVELFNPLNLTDNIVRIIREALSGNNRILVDISAFTHEALLIFVAVAMKFYPNANIEYIYCNATTYASEAEKITEKWMSRGIQDVRSVMGYAGEIDPTKDTVLIMMVGYECERAWRIIDAISPEELIITYNDQQSSTSPGNSAAGENHARLLKDLAAYYDNPRQKIIPSNDPFKSAESLDNIVDSIGHDKNIIVVPMNNKIATVGAALVALKRPEIQLCYAPAIIYNTSNYSIVGDTCYLFSLDCMEGIE